MTVSLAFFVSFLGNAKKKEKLFKIIHESIIGNEVRNLFKLLYKIKKTIPKSKF